MAIRSLKTNSFSRSLLVGNAGYDPADFRSIATITVGSGGVTSLEFTSIPSTYTHLQIRASMVNASNNYSIKLRFNSDSGTNYSAHQITGTGSTVALGAESNIDIAIFGVGAYSTSLYTGALVAEILDYSNTNKYKTVNTLSGGDGNGVGQVKHVSTAWRSTNAITSIYINADGSTFNQYTHFALYGIRS